MERPRVERGDDLADFLLCLQLSGHVESLHTCAQPSSYHPCAPDDPRPLRSLPGSPAATSHRSCPMTAPLPGPAQAWRTHPIQFISVRQTNKATRPLLPPFFPGMGVSGAGRLPTHYEAHGASCERVGLRVRLAWPHGSPHPVNPTHLGCPHLATQTVTVTHPTATS